jgi:hypothetical protein
MVKTDAMIIEIANRIKSTPKSDIDVRLDDYEREMIKFPSKWAKEAPIPELMVILTKMGHPISFSMNDERNPTHAFEVVKASKEFHRRGQLDKLIELIKKHNYFCLTGAQIMKQQDLYSLLVGGTIFKVNPNSKTLLKSAANKDSRNQKSVHEFLENVYHYSEIGEFDFIDWKIIFMVCRFDNAPVGTLSIHDRLSYTVEPNVIQRHLTRLTKKGFLQKYGLKKMSSYILTGKAWQAITEAKKLFFKDVRFYESSGSKEINNEQNGSSAAISTAVG